jgi:excisionase family DNA binding protein
MTNRADQGRAKERAEGAGGVPAEAPVDWATKRIFTTGEAAEVCKVSQQTIIRCFDNGRLSGFRVPGSKFRRIPRDELIRFMKANEIPLDALEGGRRRVLVVDDDPRILELFVDMLSREERYEVRTASTGYEAGLETASFRPHLIVLDYLLPDINGNVVCRRVREMQGGVQPRILFVSGVVKQDEVDALLAAGADGFVKKPFDVPEMLKKIARLVDESVSSGAVA